MHVLLVTMHLLLASCYQEKKHRIRLTTPLPAGTVSPSTATSEDRGYFGFRTEDEENRQTTCWARPEKNSVWLRIGRLI